MKSNILEKTLYRSFEFYFCFRIKKIKASRFYFDQFVIKIKQAEFVGIQHFFFSFPCINNRQYLLFDILK